MQQAQENLAKELRRLREQSGRSLKGLEAETHASDSSLSRYLSGKTVPPWTVVVALCRAAGRDPDELRPAWSAASQARDRKPLADPPAADALVPVDTPSKKAANSWRLPQAVLLLAVGALLGLGAAPTIRFLTHSGHAASRTSGTTGPHFSVSLLEQTGTASKATVIWSFNARCGNADEYRLVYDLPISVQHRATAYQVDHADCTLKLFDGIGGSGIGEPLTNDQQVHPVPPKLARVGSSLVAYSCCNGTVINPHR
jgi:transcriptional regulator with XRE-family HTH domain